MTTPDQQWFDRNGVPHFWVCGNRDLQKGKLRIGPAAGILLCGIVVSIALSLAPRNLAEWLILLPVVAIGAVAVAYSGLWSILMWARRDVTQTSRRMVGVVLQGLPFLLVLSIFTLLSAEPWETIGRSRGVSYALLQFSLFAVGAFVVTRGAQQSGTTIYPDIEALSNALGSEPSEFPEVAERHFPLEPPGLTRQERSNLLVKQIIRGTIVGALMGAAVMLLLTVIGFAAVDLATTTKWAGADPYVLLRWTIEERTLVITSELLHVTGFIGTFSGLAATASSLGSSSLDATIERDRIRSQEIALAHRALLALRRAENNSAT